MTHDLSDQVILVDEADRQIGVMDKVAAHRGQGQLHRAISVFLFNKAEQLLMQQRSPHKIVGAGQWANTCCGNVRPGESYEECAYRRLREELGISEVTLTPLCKFNYFTPCNEEFSEREVDQVFVGQYDQTTEPNPLEVTAVQWLTFDDLDATFERSQLAPWFPILLDQVQSTTGKQLW